MIARFLVLCAVLACVAGFKAPNRFGGRMGKCLEMAWLADIPYGALGIQLLFGRCCGWVCKGRASVCQYGCSNMLAMHANL